jgi:hypothetical protein
MVNVKKNSMQQYVYVCMYVVPWLLFKAFLNTAGI